MNPDSWLHLSFGFLMLGLAFLLMSMELRLIDLLLVEDDRPHAGGPSPPVEPDAGASGYVRT